MRSNSDVRKMEVDNKHTELNVNSEISDKKVIIIGETSQFKENFSEWFNEWISSKLGVNYLISIMKSETPSTRHKLFFNKKERNGSSATNLSKLHMMSNPGFIDGGGEIDMQVINQLIEKVFNKHFFKADPRLIRLGIDVGFLYTSCVLFPETCILHQQTVGKSRKEAEKYFLKIKLEDDERLTLKKQIQEAVNVNLNKVNESSEDDWVDISDMED